MVVMIVIKTLAWEIGMWLRLFRHVVGMWLKAVLMWYRMSHVPATVEVVRSSHVPNTFFRHLSYFQHGHCHS